jgi:hypothetical protein
MADRHGRFHPLRLAPRLHRPDPGGEAGDVLQPQIGHPQRVGHLLPLDIQDARITLGRDGLPGHVLGQVPVDHAALVGHQVGKLPQRISELLRVTEGAQRPASRRLAPVAGIRRRVEAEGRISHHGSLSGRMEESTLATLSGSAAG